MTDEPIEYKRVINFEEFGAEIQRRREAYKEKYGEYPELPRNSGKNRTESKKALLKAIEDAGGKWERALSACNVGFQLRPSSRHIANRPIDGFMRNLSDGFPVRPPCALHQKTVGPEMSIYVDTCQQFCGFLTYRSIENTPNLAKAKWRV